jgi:hypothetical protein
MIFPLFQRFLFILAIFIVYTIIFQYGCYWIRARINVALPSVLLASLLLTQSLKSTITIYLNFISLHLMKIKESQVRLIHYVKSLCYMHAAHLCQHKP